MYLTLLDLIRHWFFCVSLLCIDKKENRPEIHWVRCSWNFFGVHFLTPRCFRLFSPDKVILCTKIFGDSAFPKISFWEHEEPLVLGSNIAWQLWRVSQLFTLLEILPDSPIHHPFLSYLVWFLVITSALLSLGFSCKPLTCVLQPALVCCVLVMVVRHGPCVAHSIGRCHPVQCIPVSC